MSTLQQITEFVLRGDEEAVAQGIKTALAEGLPAKRILDEGLLAGMTEVGRLFREGEYFIPEVLVSAEAMKAGMAILRPLLATQGIRAAARAVIGTVHGDLHDIGKNLVCTMLESAGFEVEDLGVDVTAEKFMEACRRQSVQLVAMSALLTTTMPEMKTALQRLRSELRPCPKIIIGGAPLTQNFADEIGADGYGRDAASGAELAKKLCGLG